MIFIDPEGNYPRHIGDIKLASPGWELGSALPEGWILVEETAMPSWNTATERLIESYPTLVDETYYQTWTVRPYTEEELATINAPTTARQKLVALGLTDAEITALSVGSV